MLSNVPYLPEHLAAPYPTPSKEKGEPLSDLQLTQSYMAFLWYPGYHGGYHGGCSHHSVKKIINRHLNGEESTAFSWPAYQTWESWGSAPIIPSAMSYTSSAYPTQGIFKMAQAVYGPSVIDEAIANDGLFFSVVPMPRDKDPWEEMQILGEKCDGMSGRSPFYLFTPADFDPRYWVQRYGMKWEDALESLLMPAPGVTGLSYSPAQLEIPPYTPKDPLVNLNSMSYQLCIHFLRMFRPVVAGNPLPFKGEKKATPVSTFCPVCRGEYPLAWNGTLIMKCLC